MMKLYKILNKDKRKNFNCLRIYIDNRKLNSRISNS